MNSVEDLMENFTKTDNFSKQYMMLQHNKYNPIKVIKSVVFKPVIKKTQKTIQPRAF